MSIAAQQALRLVVVTAVGAAGLLVAAPAASAKSGPQVIARGSCSSGAVWKLKGKHDSGRIEVEFEVDSNRNGQTWAVTISDNGARVFGGNQVTKAPSGSFDVERHIPNRAGTDRIVATAKRGSATCTGRISV